MAVSRNLYPGEQLRVIVSDGNTRVGSRLVLSILTPQGLIIYAVRVESVYTRVENLPRILGTNQVTYTARPPPQ